MEMKSVIGAPSAPEAEVHRVPTGDPTLEEVKSLLRAPDLLNRFVADVHADGVAGEDTLIELVTLVAVSAKLDDPLGLIVKSSSGAGKSFVPEKVLSFLPGDATETVTGITPHALDSAGDTLKHKVVLLDEAPGMEKAARQLRILFSKKELVTKDPRGDRVAEGPIALVTSTTQDCIEPELESRLLQVGADESKAQTERVVAARCERAAQVGTPAAAELERRRAVWRAVFGALGAHQVSIPGLKDHLDNTFSGKLNERRGIGKLIGIIEAHAVLHQAQRETYAGVVVATENDIREALRLFQTQLAPIPPRLQQLVLELEEAFGGTAFTAPAAAAALGRNTDALKRELKKMVELGLVTGPGKHRGRVAAKYVLAKAAALPPTSRPDEYVIMTVRPSAAAGPAIITPRAVAAPVTVP